MEDILQVGVITKSHGIRGEVKVFPLTDDVKRFKKLKNAILDTGKDKIDLEIEGVKFFKQYVILKFKNYDTIESIEKYCGKGLKLCVTRENAVKLKRDEYFIADLIGIKIFDDEDNEIGKLSDVMQTGANDVYVIDMNDGRELLLPAIKECVLEVDVAEAFMKVHILDGLL